MSASKPVFLLANALQVPFSGPKSIYAPDLDLTVLADDPSRPLITAGGKALTHSKTMRAPGDDDPEVDQAECY